MTTKTKKSVAKDVVDAKVATSKSVSDPLMNVIKDVMETTEVGNTLALYDTGVEFDSEELAQDAAMFIIKGLAGALCYNITRGLQDGTKRLAEAEDQMIRASANDAEQRTERSAEQLHQRIEWCAKMDVQQVYRRALKEFVFGLYTDMTGERYQRKAPSVPGTVNSPEQSIAAKIQARRDAQKLAAQ